MSRSIDVAIEFIRKTIKKGVEDPRYYVDYIKLHKLMYLAQCFSMFHYGSKIFSDENILEVENGPYIEGIFMLAIAFGYNKIIDMGNLINYDSNPTELAPIKESVIDHIILNFGKYSTEELVELTKKTIDLNIDEKKYFFERYYIINDNRLYLVGEELFGKVDSYRLCASKKLVK